MHFDRKYNQAEENLNYRLDKVKHMLASIQITFDFLSVLELRDHSKWSAKAKRFRQNVLLVSGGFCPT